MKTSRKERRAKFDKWIDKGFLREQWIQGKISNFTSISNTTFSGKIGNVMNNKTRRDFGIAQDPELEDYIPERENEKKTNGSIG